MEFYLPIHLQSGAKSDTPVTSVKVHTTQILTIFSLLVLQQEM